MSMQENSTGIKERSSLKKTVEYRPLPPTSIDFPSPKVLH